MILIIIQIQITILQKYWNIKIFILLNLYVIALLLEKYLKLVECWL